jgi:hypothetical protein
MQLHDFRARPDSSLAELNERMRKASAEEIEKVCTELAEQLSSANVRVKDARKKLIKEGKAVRIKIPEEIANGGGRHPAPQAPTQHVQSPPFRQIWRPMQQRGTVEPQQVGSSHAATPRGLDSPQIFWGDISSLDPERAS